MEQTGIEMRIHHIRFGFSLDYIYSKSILCAHTQFQNIFCIKNLWLFYVLRAIHTYFFTHNNNNNNNDNEDDNYNDDDSDNATLSADMRVLDFFRMCNYICVLLLVLLSILMN